MTWWHPRNVRVRLALWYAGSLAVTLILYAGGVFVFVRQSLFTELDHQLREDFEVAEQMLAWTATEGIRWRSDEHHEEETGEGSWVEVWSHDGQQRLYSSASPDDGSTLMSSPPPRPGYHSVIFPGGLRARMLDGPYVVDSLPVLIRVVRSEERLRTELMKLLLVLVLGFPVAVGLAGVGGYVLARRALAPISQMAERARRMSAEQLGERLPVDNPNDELGYLAAVFNDTFSRLERSFEQLRRFTADASHELRTPLTAVRSVGEVGLREPRDAHTYRDIIGSMLEEVDRLGHLVESLLALSRADAGQIKLVREQMDVTELARDVITQLSVLAEEKEQSLVLDALAPVPALVDRVVLRRALVNLVDNAIKYTPPGGSVRVMVRNEPQGPTIQVVDTGPGIGVEHQERIFDRFYRVDKARSREVGGVGLGLSIVRWAVEAHGGRIVLVSREGMGSTFTIMLPRSVGLKEKGVVT